MQIINQSRINYEYKSSETSPTIAVTKLSNKVITYVFEGIIEVKKTVNKHCASLFDILCFKVVIHNISKCTVQNVTFNDILSPYLQYIPNSMKVNKHSKCCFERISICDLGPIYPNESITVSFSAVVIGVPFKKCITNRSTIYFDYIYNLYKCPEILSTKSNKTITKIKNNLFKEFNISTIYHYEKYFEEILYVTCKSTILQRKLIKAHCNSSKKHSTKSLFKLILLGTLTYKITFLKKECHFNSSKNSLEEKYYCYTTSFNEGFSTDITVPPGINFVDINKIPIKISTLNTDYAFIDCHSVAINSDLLLTL